MENQTSRLSMSIITLAVMVIVIATFAIPTINDLVDSQTTASQNSGYMFSAISASDLTIDVVYTAETKTIAIGDYEIILGSSGEEPVLASDSLVIRAGGTLQSPTLFIFDLSNNLRFGTSSNDLTISIVDGVYSYTRSDTAYTGTITGLCMVASETGDYGAWPYAGLADVKVNLGDHVVISTIDKGYGEYTLSTGLCDYVVGDETEDITIKCLSGANLGQTTSGVVTVSLDDVDGVAYSFDQIKISIEGTTKSPDVLFIPLEYNFIDSDDATMRNLLGVLPILLILLPVMFAASMIVARR